MDVTYMGNYYDELIEKIMKEALTEEYWNKAGAFCNYYDEILKVAPEIPCMLQYMSVKDRSFCGRIELPRKGAFTMNYSKELKDALLRRMLPPNNESITKISKEEGISEQTLRNWRDKVQYAALYAMILNDKIN